MGFKKFTARRYQLNKEALRVMESGHPWIFRSHLSSAAQIFKTGDWLALVDARNKTIGFGVYDEEGLIAIRVFKKGTVVPDIKWFKERLDAALKKRERLRQYTDAFRAIHGENDGLPGIVFDVYGRVGVLQTYTLSVDTVGRYLAQVLRKELKLKSVLWKIPSKRKSSVQRGSRLLFGKLPEKFQFDEGKLKLTVDVGAGQKSGTFLDLRALRKWIASEKFQNKRVLNLFSYTGTLGLAAEIAGAKEIWNVDISKGALDFAKKNHSLNPKKHRFIEADIFDWVQSLSKREFFDVIIVDPPNMASKMDQVPRALRAYQLIYKAVLPHLAPKGLLIACCCTSRISREKFKQSIDRWLMPQLKCLRSLQPEDDHPVGFPEGDYLKILIYG